MNITYLMNSYPLTSTTFIRREIEALERAGLQINRYAVRTSPDPLIDPLDQKEQDRTHYLLTGNISRLFFAMIWEWLVNPLKMIRTIGLTWRLYRNAKSGIVRHCAYFLQSIYFKQCMIKAHTDHVHVHFSTNATSVAMLAWSLGGPGYSFTVHGPDELVAPDRLSLSAKIDAARFVVAITEFCKSQLILFSGYEQADKIHVMRCGLDLSDYQISPPAGPENQILVCLGRLCPQKNQVMLPRIVARLKPDFPDLKVILLGDGESRAHVEQEIALHDVGDKIELHGWTENKKTREQIKKSRALLLPSLAEGLPIVIMEAMALGKPVISTYIAGIPELLDNNCGWIVPAGDLDSLEKAMRAALIAPPGELQKLGHEGHTRITQSHNIDTLAQSLKTAFTSFRIEENEYDGH